MYFVLNYILFRIRVNACESEIFRKKIIKIGDESNQQSKKLQGCPILPEYEIIVWYLLNDNFVPFLAAGVPPIENNRSTM